MKYGKRDMTGFTDKFSVDSKCSSISRDKASLF